MRYIQTDPVVDEADIRTKFSRLSIRCKDGRTDGSGCVGSAGLCAVSGRQRILRLLERIARVRAVIRGRPVIAIAIRSRDIGQVGSEQGSGAAVLAFRVRRL